MIKISKKKNNPLYVKIKSWINNNPPNYLQKLNLVGSLIFSVWALYLTHKYGESTTQLDTLHQEVGQLKDILLEDKRQTANTAALIFELRQSNNELVDQTKLLATQVSILTNEHLADNQTRLLSVRSEYLLLRRASLKLIDDNDRLILMAVNQKRPDSAMRKYFIRHVIEILKSEQNNTFLLRNRPLSNEWNDLYLDAVEALVFENLTTIEFQDKQGNKRMETAEEIENNHINMFEDFVKKCGILDLNIFKKAKWKNGETTIF